MARKGHVLRRPRGLLVGALAASLVAVLAAPAGAYQTPGITERGGGTYVSPGGRYVLFDFCHQGTCTLRRVYRQDRLTGEVVLVSASAQGTAGNGLSDSNSMTPDGRSVVFDSTASNLVAGDTNGVEDIFVKDLLTGTLERVSVSSEGAGADGRSFANSISADGRFVAFGSSAKNLVSGDTNGASDVFLRDRLEGTTERISLGLLGAQHNGSYAGGVISGDGTAVAFLSDASNLVPGDTNGIADWFVHDLETSTTERVSVASDEAEGRCYGAVPPLPGLGYTPGGLAISADGRYVAFEYCSSNLVPNNPAGGTMIYVRDRLEGTTELAAVSSAGRPGSSDCGSLGPAISDDGRFVGFTCYGAGGLVPEDENLYSDAFVRDRLLGITELVSVRSDGTQLLDSFSRVTAIGGNGRYVTISSTAELAPDDGTFKGEGYLRDLGPGVGVLPDLSVSATPSGIGVSGRASIAGGVASVASDPATDGLPGAGPAGAEITTAQVLNRPEQEDLAVRIRLDSLPQATAGLPGITYGLAFEAGGSSYEIRGSRFGGTDPAQPHFALLRCEPLCVEEASLEGSFGYTGPEAFVAVPLDLLDGATTLSSVRAYTAPGDIAGPGGVVPFDEVDLPPATLAVPRLELGVAPSGTPEDDVDFSETVAPASGRFSATLPSPGPGTWRVFVRACLVGCSAAVSAPFSG